MSEPYCITNRAAFAGGLASSVKLAALKAKLRMVDEIWKYGVSKLSRV